MLNFILFLTSIGLIWVYRRYALIKTFFFSLDKKALFTSNPNLDNKIQQYFGLFLYLTFFTQYLDPIVHILILDQVSRHIYRDSKKKVNQCSLALVPFLIQLLSSKNESYERMTLKEKAFVSLATRHIVRILSRQHRRSVPSPHYETISNLMEKQIDYLTSLIEAHQKLPNSEDPVMFARLINSHNVKVFRQHRYVDPDQYQIWGQQPPSPHLKEEWLESFRETDVAQYFADKINHLSRSYQDQNHNHIHIYILISGGIDSMTMARAALCQQFPSNITFHGLHINWRKRNEATLEAGKLQEFFQNFPDFDFRVYQSPIEPDDPNWDNKTTQYRFHLLKQIEQQSSDRTIFAMGHVIEDMIENLICNATMDGITTGKQTCLDLFGMRELIYSKVTLFRPFLLHRKPTPCPHPATLPTPYLKDNATNLDINRRIIRRAIKSHPFSVSRIRRVYEELEIMTKDLNNCIVTNMTDSDSRRWYVLNYDPEWNEVQWRYILNSIMRRYDLRNIKRNSILQLIQKIQTTDSKDYQIIKASMSKPYIGPNSFKLYPYANLLYIPIIE